MGRASFFMMVGVAQEESTTTDLSSVFRAHYERMVRTAFLLLGDLGAAEDVVQDAFVKLHRRVGVENTVAYLRTTVLNGARSRGRRLQLARRVGLAPQRDTESAEATALLTEDRRRVAGQLRRLPLRQRECLVLRYYLDLPEADIAEALGISRGSVKTHTHRGLATLAQALGEADDD